jgi:Protein of unknown function (DUF1592)/Protein of unknown function (DUF1588)/Protein of unknown function (DUF1587)/Protein of unknown function (DUF1585)/Protein of unknown function (DUF1595)/Planctomycete cytochrome C
MAGPPATRACAKLPQAVLAGVLLLAGPAVAAEPTGQPLEHRFAEVVQPFLKTYCLACHGPKKQEAKLDLSGYTSVAAVLKGQRVWDHVLERLEAEEMPPERATRQPKPHERRAVRDWLRELRAQEARRNAGDPGVVLARRLSNAEFDYTVRDLTGVDLRPAREFPVDPANEAGFDNSGESLTMSPALLKKYLAAARRVADHLVLTPGGFAFAPHPVVTDTERDQYGVQRIVAFYQRHRLDYADYFLAAWRFRRRAALGKPEASLHDFAVEAGLSARYLATVWSVLAEDPPAPGPLGDVQARWRDLPADVQAQGEARRACERLRDLVVRLRVRLTPDVAPLRAKGISQGSQPFMLWRNRQLAAQHLRSPGAADPARAQALARFCRVFPDAFVVTERAPYYDPSSSKRGRLLSAGFHLMYGFFRDDGPLYELVLDEPARCEIDALWDELHFVTLDPIRQYKDFVFFERAEPPRFMQEAVFDFARSEDQDVISEAKIARLRAAYLAKARTLGASALALETVETYFTDIAAQIRRVEQVRRAAEPSHLAALQAFAARAYRRPLAAAERDELLAFYRTLRDRDRLGHEDAVRDTVASILLSPHFLYRLDLPAPGVAVRPLPDYALASRLSYFLWSSMRDDELLAHAAVGDLHRPDVLAAQARRMLRDARVRGLAEQFAGNWLDFRRFEETNTVDRGRFPTFTNDLRQAMAEEPVCFFVHVAGRGRSVLDFLDADYTFVNAALAKHYGMPVPDGGPDRWVQVDGAHRYGRGGLLPMSVFLTKNAPGLRTSPVKRGYWVVRRLLGEHIPPPPPEVPELPKDEATLGDRTLPQLLARHREHRACAACHQRFDALGLAFEGYGPVGERRTLDLGGRPVETHVVFPDGSDGTGLDGLRRYLADKRREEFVENLCQKLFAYALGRSLVPSDKPTADAMRARLAADGHRFDSLVESIVTSPQFLNQRGRDDPRD